MKQIAIILLMTFILASCDDEIKDLNKDISVPVSVLELIPGSLEEYISTNGTVKPLKEVVLKSEIRGTYKLLKNRSTGKYYVLGDYVKTGSEIIHLDARDGAQVPARLYTP